MFANRDGGRLERGYQEMIAETAVGQTGRRRNEKRRLRFVDRFSYFVGGREAGTRFFDRLLQMRLFNRGQPFFYGFGLALVYIVSNDLKSTAGKRGGYTPTQLAQSKNRNSLDLQPMPLQEGK